MNEKSVYRVLLVVRWPVGGIRTFLKYVTSFFPSDRYEFSIVTVNSVGVSDLMQDLSHVIRYWKIVEVDDNVLKKFHSAVTSEIKNNDYDLVHAHGFTSLVFSILGKFFSDTPLVFTSHDVLSSLQFSGFKGSLKKLLLAYAIKQCDIIHSVSFDAERNLRSFFPFIRDGSSNVIINGVDSELFFRSARLDLNAMFDIAEDKIIVGFFGRFMSQKGFVYLIEALEMLLRKEGEARFHIVCFGSGAFLREEKAAIANRKLSEFFTFSPFIPEVSAAIKGCDVIAMPSLWEACPLQPMEALCSGVPFVGTDCVGLREVLAGTPAVMVKSGDAKSLAEGILQCVKKGREPFEEY
ncbi:glycosyltransferase family 4 protein, partial [Corallibacter sp.]|uniref:glycosyltransferase family 4 protein n=1 Tax=Corallibacter sp. TaxID=2038084 RepID=UPI003AB8864A